MVERYGRMVYRPSPVVSRILLQKTKRGENEADNKIEEAGSWTKQKHIGSGFEYVYNSETKEIRPPGHFKPITVQVPQGKYGSVERELRWRQYREIRGDRQLYYMNTANLETTWKFPFIDPDSQAAYAQPPPEFTFTPVPDAIPNAPLLRRALAAGIDIASCAAVAGVHGALMYAEVAEAAQPALAIAFTAAFTARDTLLDGGTRSLGKRAMRLEVIKSDGTLPSRVHTFGRNVYYPILYLAINVGIIMEPTFLYGSGAFYALDTALLLGLDRLGKGAARVGDFMTQTRVIDEQPDRSLRLREREIYVKDESER